MILDNIPKEDKISYTKLHKIVYLVDKMLREKYTQNIGYKFDDIMSHKGPYDKELQDNIDTWSTIGLIRNNETPFKTEIPGMYVSSHNVKLTERGKSHFDNIGMKRLTKALGSEQAVEWLKNIIKEFASKKDDDIIQEAVLQWSHDHPSQTNEIKNFFPFLDNASTVC